MFHRQLPFEAIPTEELSTVTPNQSRINCYSTLQCRTPTDSIGRKQKELVMVQNPVTKHNKIIKDSRHLHKSPNQNPMSDYIKTQEIKKKIQERIYHNGQAKSTNVAEAVEYHSTDGFNHRESSDSSSHQGEDQKPSSSLLPDNQRRAKQNIMSMVYHSRNPS